MINSIKKQKYTLLLIIFIICLISSLILSTAEVHEICDDTNKCDIVQNSKYAYTFGIKNSIYGIAIFSILSLLTFFQIKKPSKNKEKIISLSIILGSIIAIYFLYLQEFVLKAYCKYCLIVDISLIIALIILIAAWKK